MIVFADSSAIVTAYADTKFDVLPARAVVVVSDLARVEVPSALWRKARLHELSAAYVARVLQAFEADWNGFRYQTVRIEETVLERAARIAGTHELRTLDAIQLASALAIRAVEPACRTMVVLDERLRRAAAAEGFSVLPA